MGQRITRVNELVKRELSHLLHTNFNVEAVRITITSVEVAPNLRNARVYYSVIGGPIHERKATQLLNRIGYMLQSQLAKNVTLKYTPQLSFHLDRSIEHGVNLVNRIDEVTQDLEDLEDES